MNVLVIAGYPDKKFFSKIAPIQQMREVEMIFVVTRFPFPNPPTKVCICSPPALFRITLATGEFWRLLSVLALTIRHRIKFIIGIHYLLHCVYTALAGILFKIPYIFLIIENPRLHEKRGHFWFFAKHALKIGVRGNKSKHYLVSKGIDAKKIFIPPNVYDFSETWKIEGARKEYDLLYMGNLIEGKRLDILFEAITIVKQEIPNIRVAIAGSGDKHHFLQSLARKLNIEENIEFTGYKEEINVILNKSKALILTSQSEGMPMVMVEAMACGLPCIMPDVGDVTDVAIHQYNALVVEPLNVQGFADAIIHLLQDEKLYHRLSENALKIRTEKRQEYSLENLINTWRGVITKK